MHFDDRERKVDMDWDVSDQWQVRIMSSLFLSKVQTNRLIFIVVVRSTI